MGWSVIGLPLLATAIVAFLVAFSTRYTWASLAGAVIAVPLCLYLMDMPYLHWASIGALGGNFLSVVALRRGRHDIAFAMLLPFMLVNVLIAILWFRNFPVFTGFRF